MWRKVEVKKFAGSGRFLRPRKAGPKPADILKSVMRSEDIVQPAIDTNSQGCGYPRADRGYFHLTPRGWKRKDSVPFPKDRIETWFYETECPAEDAKEQVTLTRSWACANSDPETKRALHAAFGGPVEPTASRNVTLKCRV